MTINTISQTLTTFPTAPSRDQDQTTFTTNAENHIVALGNHVEEVNVQIGQINTAIDEMNTDIATTNQNVIDAQTAATESANSASLAASTANNNGSWSSLTGSFPVGEAVNHNDSVWVSNFAIPDVTASEPSDTNPDWTEVSSSSNAGWLNSVIATESLASNTKVNIFATLSAVDATLPLPVIGDYLVITNDVLSTQTVRFIVSGSTQFTALNGTTYTATSNITMSPGEKIYMACTKNAGTWEQK